MINLNVCYHNYPIKQEDNIVLELGQVLPITVFIIAWLIIRKYKLVWRQLIIDIESHHSVILEDIHTRISDTKDDKILYNILLNKLVFKAIKSNELIKSNNYRKTILTLEILMLSLILLAVIFIFVEYQLLVH